ncbi:MAG: hypothetical protein SGPRY_012214, partial [Prymnesium sp.]
EEFNRLLAEVGATDALLARHKREKMICALQQLHPPVSRDSPTPPSTRRLSRKASHQEMRLASLGTLAKHDMATEHAPVSKWSTYW